MSLRPTWATYRKSHLEKQNKEIRNKDENVSPTRVFLTLQVFAGTGTANSRL